MITPKRMTCAEIAIAIAAAASVMSGCMGDPAETNTGSIGMEVQIAPGITISTASWTINNSVSGFTKSGTVNGKMSNLIELQTGALPSGTGYMISLTATSADGSFSCTGSAGFQVTTGVTTIVNLTLSCSSAAGQGQVVVIGTTQICANLDSLGASPLETTVGNPIMLTASSSAGTLATGVVWTATAGTFDNPASATPTFTCPATPGPVTITATAQPSAPGCPNTTSQSVTVTCDTVDPTFTNVYNDIIGVKCIGCHKPGGGGVAVGMLDMSSQATAYGNLVGVSAMGVGAGTSGVTCASAMLTRVVAGDPNNSLLFNKVHAKLVAANPPCGSAMPLGPTVITQAEVDLISAWIAAGAMNN
jgi:hypothetical protein